MASPAQTLPPGWTAEWNAENQRYLFIETATGTTSWDLPDQGPMLSPPPALGSAVPGTGKRRRYAEGQVSAYSGTVDSLGTDPGSAYPLPNVERTGQFFTPGLVGEQQFAGQQQQALQAQPGYFPAGQAGGQPPTPMTPAYGSQPYVQAPQMGALADQFGQMGMGGQKPVSLSTVNLLTAPPDPAALLYPPPAIRLPPNACLSPAPTTNAHHSYMRCTLNAIPTSSSLLGKSKIPLALIITPYRTVGENEEPVPIISDQLIPRCRRCRTYINPFVAFIDNGNRWKCSMCNMTNEVPQLFDWDQAKNQPADRWTRDELNHSVVEYVAPTEYMVRAAPPTVYVFAIDVSHSAIGSGMVATATRTLLESLDRLPNDDGRTRIAIICYDVALYFFSMPVGSTEASVLVVSDIDDVFLPRPQDLLVSLKDARVSIEALLVQINHIFKDNLSIGGALGPTLQAALKLMTPLGGQIIALVSTLPSVGAGALKNREDPKILGTTKESSLLQAADSFYKTFAIECSRLQVSVDMFLFSAQYQDVATLAYLPHYTSGQTFYYPGFNAARPEDAIKFGHEFAGVVAMPIMLEAVQRVRASRGLRMASFHGNFFVRSTDLLSMPAVPQDQSYAIEVQIEDNLTAPFVVFQAAVLHTTCFGERRIRVINLCLPTTSNLSDVFASADQNAIATLLANKAVERSVTHKLEDARDAVFSKLVEIIAAYKATMTGGSGGGQLAIPENMKMLPALMLGLLKNVAIRQSMHVPPDIRAYAQTLFVSLPTQRLIPYLFPTFYALHTMPPEVGTVGEHGIQMPLALPLLSERMERHGLYLMEDGISMYLWVGRDAVPQLLIDVFNVPSYDAVPGGLATLPLLDNPFSQRVNAIIQKTREMRRGVYWPNLYVVKEEDARLRALALNTLIQDQHAPLPSYQQFIQSIQSKVNA